MKKNFNDLLNGTEAGMLGDTVESIKEEKVPAATVARIQSKVIGVSAAKRNTRKKMLPYIAAAACFTVFVSVVIAVGVFNRSVPDHAETSAAISDPAETSAVISDPGETNAPSVPERSGPETSAPEDVPLFTGAVIKALEPKECEDAFLPQAVGVEFTGGAGDADRIMLSGLRIYECGGKTYMIYSEEANAYEFDGNAFYDTGVKIPGTQFLSSGEYNGKTYVCRIENILGYYSGGIYEVDIASGSVNLIIDSVNADCAALAGAKLYYSVTLVPPDCEEGKYTCAIRCADLETREIREIYEDKGINTVSLKVIDGKLFFEKGGDVCWIGEDGCLYSLPTGDGKNHWDYAVSGGVIYVTGYDYADEDGRGTVRYYVRAYGCDGALIGGVTESDRYFHTGFCDRLAVYNGKIVAYDKNGVYLLDTDTWDYEMIISAETLCGENDPDNRYNAYKDVYGGKLYVRQGKAIVEYSEEGVRTFKEDPATHVIKALGDTEYQYKYVHMIADWPYYGSAREITEKSGRIFTGTVTDISFAIIDKYTGKFCEGPASENVSLFINTIYTVEVAETYKGENADVVLIGTYGGIAGYKEYEQHALLVSAGLIEPDSNAIFVCAGSDGVLELGREYLFCTCPVTNGPDMIINPTQFAQDPDSGTAKDIIKLLK